MIAPAAARRLGRVTLAVFGIGLLLLGIRFFVDPAALTRDSGVAMPTVAAAMEIRTVYGGVFAGVGLAMIGLGVRSATLVAGLWLLMAVSGVTALARLGAIALGQAPDAMFATLLVIELLAVAAAAVALRGLAPRG